MRWSDGAFFADVAQEPGDDQSDARQHMAACKGDHLTADAFRAARALNRAHGSAPKYDGRDSLKDPLGDSSPVLARPSWSVLRTSKSIRQGKTTSGPIHRQIDGPEGLLS